MTSRSSNQRPNQFERHMQRVESRRGNPQQPSKQKPMNPLELQRKNINVSAGGCFYEKAKSRSNRTKEVFRNDPDGQAVVNDAVPLGSKLNRRDSGAQIKRRLSQLSKTMNNPKSVQKRSKLTETSNRTPTLPLGHSGRVSKFPSKKTTAKPSYCSSKQIPINEDQAENCEPAAANFVSSQKLARNKVVPKSR